MTTINREALVKSIVSAIDMSGLLFQRHPEHPEWDTTRPGARLGEVAAFVRNVEDEPKSYISVCRWYEGEQDPDLDEPYQEDCWEIITSHYDGTQGFNRFIDVKDVAEYVADEMKSISNPNGEIRV